MSMKTVGLCLGVASFLLFGVMAGPGQAQDMKQVYLRMNASSYEQFGDAINQLEDRGALIRHRIYPIAAMGLIPEGSEASIGGLAGVRQIFVEEIAGEQMLGMTEQEIFLAKAYNNIFFSKLTQPRSEALPDIEPVPVDLAPRSIPEEYIEEMKDAWRGVPGVPPPLPEATSEFLMGHIAVAAILPESDPGFGNHNWAKLEEEKATEEVISAMDWWARHSPNQELRISYEINYAVSVQTEPMEKGQDSIEHIWAGQSLTDLGYKSGNHFQKSYQYINDMRLRYDADWGFIVFVLHGFPGQQFNRFLAYAYLGGPFNVNVYSNGYLGPGKLDRVIAHESGHTFYTLDEYPLAPASCSSRSGYLNAENANKQQGGSSCKSDVPCVMRAGGQPTPFEILDPCHYTVGQVGWWDSDEDGVADILDMDPVVDRVVLESGGSGGVASVDTIFGSAATLRGSVSAVPLPNKNPLRSMLQDVDFTVEHVAAEYRLNDGPWTPCEPTDGRFDSSGEGFWLALEYLTPLQVHTVDVRAVTAHGNATPDDMISSFELVFVYDPEPPIRILSSNPVSPPVSVSFEPSHSSGRVGVIVSVEVAVYDALGRKLKTLESGDFRTGRFYDTRWDGTGPDGHAVPAGVYFVGMRSEGRMVSNKLLVIP